MKVVVQEVNVLCGWAIDPEVVQYSYKSVVLLTEDLIQLYECEAIMLQRL